MLGHQMITRMFDYNAWANDRILACAASLTDEQLNAPTEHSMGSLRETLYHLHTVESAWRHVCQEHVAPQSMPTEQDLATVEALEAFKADHEERVCRFLGELTDDDLAATIVAKDRNGNEHSFVLWEMLVHINHHSAQHRSEAAAILTNHGQSPGDIDFVFFVEGH